MAIILAIETSCDDTAVAVLDGKTVLSNIISSQEIHNKWGGIVPELASREHISVISQIVRKAIESAKINISMIDLIAVTNKPGLSGSLIVGTSFAKGLAIMLDKPIYPINHIEGHVYSSAIDNEEIGFPYISLVVSGGHTSVFMVNGWNDYRTLISTMDDAAGEAYDKTAKLLGLGYPGGPIIDKLSKSGNPHYVDFPRSMIKEVDRGFSFSGLKTSIRRYVQSNYENGIPDEVLPDICASVQEAINEVLVRKTFLLAKKHGINSISVNGGVSANSDLRKKFYDLSERENLNTYFPAMEYSIDNAAMIGYVAQHKHINSQIIDSGILSSNMLEFMVNSDSIRSKN